MDWVHCNKCFKMLDEIKLLIGSCKHIICPACVVRATCAICSKPFKGMEINDKLPPDVKAYFEDPMVAAARLQRTIKFQFEHRTSLEVHKTRTVLPKLAKAQAENKTLKRAIATLEASVHKETSRIHRLQMYLAQQKVFAGSGESLAGKRRRSHGESILSTPTMSTSSSTSGRKSLG